MADLAGVLELALDASDSIDAKNSLEKMLAHQMAVVHRTLMKLTVLIDDIQLRLPHCEGFQERNIEICRIAGTIARLTTAYQSGMLALQRTHRGWAVELLTVSS
jgi:hypothetical protein